MPVQLAGAMTAERYYRAIDPRLVGRDVFAWMISERGPIGKKAARHSVILPPVSEVSEAPAVIPHLRAWKWLVACPDCTHDFQLAFEAGLFMCSWCWNAEAGGVWRRVEFPANRADIERALGAVPAGLRNWLPGWTVERVSIEAANPVEMTIADYREALKRTA